MPPQTGYEVDGGWTSLADEAAFLATLAAETDAMVTIAGQSVEGRDIHRIDLGSGPDRTLMVTSLIHADEPATREALLAWLRDLAYSTDPTMVAYLATHRIVALTPCNPDGQVLGTRNNANNVNINRDFYRLTQPETRLIHAIANDARPHLAVDAHEFQGAPENEQWMGRAGGNPMTQPAIRAMQDAAYEAAKGALDIGGYSTAPYWIRLSPRQGWSSVLGIKNITGILSETNTAHDPAVRIAVQRTVLDAVVAFHHEHAHELTEARTAAVMRATTVNNPIALYTKQFLGDDIDPEVVHVEGYTLDQPLPAEHATAFEIEASADHVSMLQPAQAAIPAIVDATSEDAVVAAVRVQASPPRTRVVGMRVDVEGRARDVSDTRYTLGTDDYQLVM